MWCGQFYGFSVIAIVATTASSLLLSEPPTGYTSATWPVPVPKEQGFINFIEQYPMTRGDQALAHGFPARFDWHLFRPGFYLFFLKDPKTVFTSSGRPIINLVLGVLESLYNNTRNDRILYVTGDALLSEYDKVKLAKLKRLFQGGIFWQAKDVPMDGIMAAPDGLNENYARVAWNPAANAIAAARIDVEAKPKIALAAWGTLHALRKLPSRRGLESWLRTPLPALAGVEHNTFDMKVYWGEMAKYRFLLAPPGAGVQSPKVDEALLVLTIPIIQRDGMPAFDELKKMGWPIVVIDDWREITRKKLDDWWQELSPRLVSFRKNCLTTEGFWRIISGELKRCE